MTHPSLRFRDFVLGLFVTCITAFPSEAQGGIGVDDCGTIESDGFFCLLWRADSTGLLYVLQNTISPLTNQQMQVGEHFRVIGLTVPPIGATCWVVVDAKFSPNWNYACGPISIGTSQCPGDGTMLPCPCGNESALGLGEGCMNSQGHGAILSAIGSPILSVDDVVFHVEQARPNQPGVLFESAGVTLLPFRDGVLCSGAPQVRVEYMFADASGSASSTFSYLTIDNPSPGQHHLYQYWYRDPQLSPCGNGSNLSQALRVYWY